MPGTGINYDINTYSTTSKLQEQPACDGAKHTGSDQLHPQQEEEEALLVFVLPGLMPPECTPDSRSGVSRILCTSSENAWLTATLALALVSANKQPNYCANLWPSSRVTSLAAS